MLNEASVISELLERKSEIDEQIESFQALLDFEKSQGKRENVKTREKVLKALRAELLEIESEMKDRESEIELYAVCQTLSTGKANPSSVFASACKNAGIAYNARLTVDYVFSTGIAFMECKPLKIRTSRSSVIVKNAIPMPAIIRARVSVSDNKSFSEFKKENDLQDGTEFSSVESAFMAFVSCYGGLLKSYSAYNAEFEKQSGKPSKYESASARDKLSRLTKNGEAFAKYFDTTPTGEEGKAVENASQVVGT